MITETEKNIQSHFRSKITPLVLTLCAYEDVTNEFYETGINDDKLALLAKTTDFNEIAIKLL